MYSDKPISTSKDDLFNRSVFARKLARVISERNQKDGFVIGINAPWGEGKTSLLNMVREQLDNHILKKNGKLFDGHIVIVDFNPWRYGDENLVLKAFFEKLASSLETSLKKNGEKAGDLVRKYGGALSVFDLASVSIAGLVNVKPNAEALSDAIASLLTTPEIDELRTRIKKILEECPFKILVMMDDVDRLDKDEIRSLFRLIKLSADFPNVIYLLAFDENRVAEALAESFGSAEAGRRFLEKIVQLPLSLPPLTSQQLIELTFNNINKLFADYKIDLDRNRDESWSYFFISTFGGFLSSPRLVMQYINRLWFSVPEAKGEVNMFDLQTFEAVRTFLPDLFKAIRNKKELLLRLDFYRMSLRKENASKEFERILAALPETQREVSEKIIVELFPENRDVLQGHSYGGSSYETLVHDKRICTAEYFSRYFDLGVGNDDVSDSEVESFLRDCCALSPMSRQARFNSFLTGGREEVFLRKILQFIGPLNEESARCIAVLLAENCGLFTKRPGNLNFFSFDAFSLAGYVVSKLLDSIDGDEDRVKFAVELANASGSSDFLREFAVYFADEARRNGHEVPSICIAINDAMVSRFKQEVTTSTLEELYPERSSSLYFNWLFSDRESLIAHLLQRVDADCSAAAKFVLSFKRLSWDVGNLAENFGFDFLTTAILSEKNLELPNLIEFSPGMRIVARTEDEYLGYFIRISEEVAIAKKDEHDALTSEATRL